MQVCYLTPSGMPIDGCDSTFSLEYFAGDGFLNRHAGEPYAMMLANILKEIYREYWNHV